MFSIQNRLVQVMVSVCVWMVVFMSWIVIFCLFSRWVCVVMLDCIRLELVLRFFFSWWLCSYRCWFWIMVMVVSVSELFRLCVVLQRLDVFLVCDGGIEWIVVWFRNSIVSIVFILCISCEVMKELLQDSGFRLVLMKVEVVSSRKLVFMVMWIFISCISKGVKGIMRIIGMFESSMIQFDCSELQLVMLERNCGIMQVVLQSVMLMIMVIIIMELNWWLCKSCSWIIGWCVCICLMVSRMKLSMEVVVSQWIFGEENYCLCLFFFSIIVSLFSFSVRLVMLNQLVLVSCLNLGCLQGMVISSKVMRVVFMGRLMKKVQCQLMFLVNQFFIIGFSIGLRMVVVLNRVLLIGCCECGRCVVMMVMVVGMSVLLVKFCLIWFMIIIGSVVERLYSIENKVKRLVVVSSSMCNFSSCFSQVDMGMMMILVIRQVVVIQVFLVFEVLIFFWMVGSEELMMEMFSVVISVFSVLVVIVSQVVVLVFLGWVFCLMGWVGVVLFIVIFCGWCWFCCCVCVAYVIYFWL